jgi:hypothetical protein
MPARKSSASESKASVNPALPGKSVRKLEDVALEIRRLRDEEKLTTQEINAKLQVSFDVINQLFLQSYKMTMNTNEVFKAQEELRLEQG